MKSKNSKDEKNNFNKVLSVIRLILILVIIFCAIYILLWFIENKKNSNMLKEITDSSIKDTIVIEVPINKTDNNSTETETSQEQEKIEITTYELDFDKLLSINSATVGWITVPNTTINYPVVKAGDNSFYLNHSFDKTKNGAGWIFADYRNKFDGTDKNIIIYGHNRMDSSMFATLANTQKSYWYNNSNNKYITFTTPTETQVYEVFSVYTIKMESFYLTTTFQNNTQYLNFLNTLKSRSVHDFGTNLSENDNIITLSTCDATGKSRVILHAKRIA